MSDLPFSPLNPIQPSDFLKNDIPAETDDLQLGRRTSEATDTEGKSGSQVDREDTDVGPGDPAN